MKKKSKKTVKQAVKHRPGTIERREFKNKVRRSPEWAELREEIYKRQNGVDPISLRPLLHGWNCHHMQCEDWKLYDDLDPDKFVGLSSKNHSMIHQIWTIVKREGDLDVLERIRTVLDRMMELNNEYLS